MKKTLRYNYRLNPTAKQEAKLIEFGALERRHKGSNRWQKTKQRINKLHGKISRQRLDFAHKISQKISNESDILVFEYLHVKAMQRFNRSMVADNVMGLI